MSYDKFHPLQIKWNKAARVMMCLCTMRESCSNCDMESTQRRRDEMNEVIVEARNAGYQLYYESGHPIKMVRTTTSGYELD